MSKGLITRIRIKMTEQGLSEEDVATKLGIGFPQLHNILNGGTAMITRDLRAKLDELLGTHDVGHAKKLARRPVLRSGV